MKIQLIDGNSFIHRAYHSSNELYNYKGELINAVYNMVKMLKDFIEKSDTNYVAVVYDHTGKTFRHDKYPLYKSNRTIDEKLRKQKIMIYEITQAMGFEMYKYQHIEADDVIGTMTKKLCNLGHEVQIVTGDKDFCQILNDKVSLLNTKGGKNEITKNEEVFSKYGVRANEFLDFLALMGDSSDNIPGAKGIGEVTAKTLIEHFSSIKNLYENINEIDGLNIRGKDKVKNILLNDIENIRLSYFLAKIQTELDLKIDYNNLNNFKFKKPNNEELSQIFLKYGLKKFSQEVLSDNFYQKKQQSINKTLKM